MPPDAARLQAQLAQRLDDLYQLQVVEAAEEVVRRRYRQLLASQLNGLRDDLVCAQQHLQTARGGSDLVLIVRAEERVCDILRQTTLVQRETGEYIRAAKRAHQVYLAQRGQLVRRIDKIRRRIA